jgi:hypothetical protein
MNCRFWGRPRGAQWHTMLWLANNYSYSGIASALWCCVVKPLTKICTVKLLKSGRSVSDWVYPHKNVDGILLQPENAWTDTSFKTQEAVTKLRWTVIPHPPFSSDVLPQISSFLEPSEVQFVGKGLGMMTWLLKKWPGDCKYKIQTVTKRE